MDTLPRGRFETMVDKAMEIAIDYERYSNATDCRRKGMSLADKADIYRTYARLIGTCLQAGIGTESPQTLADLEERDRLRRRSAFWER